MAARLSTSANTFSSSFRHGIRSEKLRLSEDHTVAIQVGRSVVSFTIKSIDAREKLKREIEPLLNRNRNNFIKEN